MKTKIHFLIVGFLIFVSYNGYSQLRIAQLDNARCPGVAVSYTVNNPVNAACVYDWVVTNGTIQGGSQSGNTSTLNNVSTTVTITWSSLSTAGSINVSAKSCSPTTGNSSVTLPAAILSLTGVNPGTIEGSPGATAIRVNSTPNLVYTVPQIQYPNRGSLDPNPYNITTYEWEIPSGWSVVSGGTSNTITVRADNCGAGNIRVRGKASCPNGNFFSNWSSPLGVTRTLGNPAAISGPVSVNCTDITTKTYSIAAIAGATSYTWTFPSGWTGTSTTPSITLTPNGLNAGTVTVRANGCSLQSAVSSLPIAITLTNPNNPPSVSGASPVCFSGASFTLSNFPAGSTVNWTQSSNLTTISGQGTTSYTVRASSPTIFGQGWVEAIITTPCGPLAPIRNNLWVGQPQRATDILRGSGSIAIGSSLEFTVVEPNNGAAGAVSYDWEIIGGYFTYGQATGQNADVTVTDQQLILYVAIRNVCGPSTQIVRSWSTENGGCPPGEICMARVFPNPATETLTVQFNTENSKHIKLVNSKSEVVFESTELGNIKSIPLNNLSEGTYYLIIQEGKTTTKERVIIKK